MMSLSKATLNLECMLEVSVNYKILLNLNMLSNISSGMWSMYELHNDNTCCPVKVDFVLVHANSLLVFVLGCERAKRYTGSCVVDCVYKTNTLF